jgi:C1A family cysteine protease
MPLGSEPPLASGHCMCAVGYQDDKSYPRGGYFIVRNSWGTTWASQSPYGAGYGIIPYQYITSFATEAAHMPQRKGGPVS